MSGEKRYFFEDVDGNMVAFDDDSICIHKDGDIVRILVERDCGIDVLIKAIKSAQDQFDLDICI